MTNKTETKKKKKWMFHITVRRLFESAEDHHKRTKREFEAKYNLPPSEPNNT